MKKNQLITARFPLIGILLMSITIFHSFIGVAQLSINTSSTPAQMVNILTGGSLEVSGIIYKGDLTQSAEFTSTGATTSELGFSKGIILSTMKDAQEISKDSYEDIWDPFSSSNQNDNDLESLTGFLSWDANTLEFDFVAQGNQVGFRYVFASEEYAAFVCDQYNDAFGFFLSGPGISGGVGFENDAINLATLPNTNLAISVNTVNDGIPDDDSTYCTNLSPNWRANSIYYRGNSVSTTIVFKGSTVVLTAKTSILPTATYHIKMVIADMKDDGFDSGVFLEGGSFSTLSDLNITAVSDTICLGESINLDANINAGIPNYTYTWTDGSSIIQTTADVVDSFNQVTVSPTSTTTYTLTVEDGNANDPLQLTEEITIHVLDTAEATFTQLPPLCIGGALFQLPNTSSNGYTGSWSPAPDSTKTEVYTFVADADQCVKATMTIEVNPAVTAIFSQVAPICSGDPLFSLPRMSNNGYSGVWSPNFDNTATTVYTFNADPDQCAIDTVMTVEVNDCGLSFLVPNVFSPNGDGSNDVFTVKSKNLIALDMEIYNRWGQLLYSWNSINGSWDGSTSKGNQVPDGTYFYIAKIVDSSSEGFVKKGIFTLVR